MAKAAKDAGLRHVDLVDARRHAQVGAADRQSHADAHGKIQGRPFRRQGRSRQHLPRHWACPTTFLYTSFYWDNFDQLRHGSEARSGRSAGDHLADGRQETARHRPPRTSASAPTGSSRRGRSSSARPSGSPARHLTGAQMAAALTKALGKEVRYNAVDARGLPRRSAFRAPKTWATCSSSSATSRRTTAASATSTFSRSLNPELQTFDAWLAANKTRIPLE